MLRYVCFRSYVNESIVTNFHKTMHLVNVRYSPESIKFAISILGRGGHALYERIRSVFYLPSREYLTQFKPSSANDPDGVQHGVLDCMVDIADASGFNDWERHGALCFDSMTLRQVTIRECVFCLVTHEAVVSSATQDNE